MNSPSEDATEDCIVEPNRPSPTNLVFNTFRSHLSVLRASVSEDQGGAAATTTANNEYNRSQMKSPNNNNDMTWPENLFFSPEDELVNENEWQYRMYGIAATSTEEDDHQKQQVRQRQQWVHDSIANMNSEDQNDDISVRTDDYTQVTKIKRRKRGKKAKNASMVGAFVTFSKALFGIGMLSNPAVLGEVGLILGTFIHLFIIVGCAFACYLLLMSRQIAKRQVLMKQFEQHQKLSERKRWEMTSSIRTRMKSLIGSTMSKGRSNEPEPQVTGGYLPPAISLPRENFSTSIEMTPSPTKTVLKTPVHTNQLNRQKNSVTGDYQLMSSALQATPPRPPIDPNPEVEQPQKVRLVTYGDVVKYLAGERASVFIIFTIVTVHLMFASGMTQIAVENLCYVIGMNRLGWSVVEEEILYDDDAANKFQYYHYTVNNNDYNFGSDDDGGNNDDANVYNDDVNNDNNERYLNSGSSHSGSRDQAWSQEEQMYLQWEGPVFTERLTMATMIFPIILVLLQIPSLRELATISSIGLITYAVGCVGTMMYVAIVKTSGHPFQDHPEEMWTAKWSGIPTYVATTVYAIEGINLALPTVISVEGIQRMWMLKGRSNPDLSEAASSGGNEGSNKVKNAPDLSVYIVCGAVFFYGFITLIVSWLGLAGGLGGGIGTIHEEAGCPDVTYCLNSSNARFVYLLSLSIALILTLPVILYPSTEMLEIWLDEREEKRQKRREAALLGLQNEVDPPQPQVDAHARRKLVNSSRQRSILQSIGEDDDAMGSPTSAVSDEKDDLAGSISIRTESDVVSPIQDDSSVGGRLNARMRRLKYWKLRMILAGTIIVIGTIEGSFPQVLKVAEVIRGVGLSIAGLIFPPLLYMSAVGGSFGTGMAAAMSLLVGLGLFNICLVLMSAFGGKDYIMEEGGAGSSTASFYELDFD